MPGAKLLPPAHRARHLWMACSVMLHGVLLNHVGRPADTPPAQEAARASALAPVFATLRSTAQHEQTAAPETQVTTTSTQRRTIANSTPVETTDAQQPPTPETDQPFDTEQQLSGAQPPSSLLDGRYWPGKLLDQRPQAQSPIVIPFPDGFISIRSGRAILQLFIDEHGVIDNIEVVEVDGPVEFAALAKRTLQFARFSPGLINHTAVRSMIKIEVAFQEDAVIGGQQTVKSSAQTPDASAPRPTSQSSV